MSLTGHHLISDSEDMDLLMSVGILANNDSNTGANSSDRESETSPQKQETQTPSTSAAVNPEVTRANTMTTPIDCPTSTGCALPQAEAPPTALSEIQTRAQQYIDESQNKNTMRKLYSSQRKFADWLGKKGEKTEMVKLPPQILDQYIAGWILDMRKDDGSNYEPNTVSSFVRSIAKYLGNLGYAHDVINNKKLFNLTHKVLASKRKELKRAGKGNLPNKAKEITCEEEEQLWQTGALGLDDPEALLSTVWFHTTKLLGFRGAHESRQLRWGDFEIVYENQAVAFIKWNERTTKTRDGNSTHRRAFDPKLFPGENPARCPVNAFMKYGSKRPIEFCNDDSPFYLGINYNRPSDDSPFFKKIPMGYDRIGSIMSRMAVRAGLVGHFTNHSVRRTMVSQLVRAGVAPILVAQLSGHKNVASLSYYATASEDQQRQMSALLQNQPPSASVIGASISSDATPAVDIMQPRVPDSVTQTAPGGLAPVRDNARQLDIERPGMQNIREEHSLQQMSRFEGTFSGATFYGNVTINM